MDVDLIKETQEYKNVEKYLENNDTKYFLLRITIDYYYLFFNKKNLINNLFYNIRRLYEMLKDKVEFALKNNLFFSMASCTNNVCWGCLVESFNRVFRYALCSRPNFECRISISSHYRRYNKPRTY